MEGELPPFFFVPFSFLRVSISLSHVPISISIPQMRGLNLSQLSFAELFGNLKLFSPLHNPLPNFNPVFQNRRPAHRRLLHNPGFWIVKPSVLQKKPPPLFSFQFPFSLSLSGIARRMGGDVQGGGGPHKVRVARYATHTRRASWSASTSTLTVF